MLRHCLTPSPVGPLLLVADGADRLCGLYTDGHRGGPAHPPGVRSGGGVLDAAVQQLDAYFAGELTGFDLPLHAVGSPWQRRVWAALVAIPFGTTTTYGALAVSLGLPCGAARAVGSANARNPISIIVPCHRVVGAAGALTGYAGGLAAKRTLLEHEGAGPASLPV
jgi:methylated-DNA-[protein]-cysteine S-methyltransferase